LKTIQRYKSLLLAGGILLLAACAAAPPAETDDPERDSGPRVAPDLSHLQDHSPTALPRSRYGNPETYEVFGQTYRVMAEMPETFTEEGMASWYGKKFHGRRTSSGETYDMYQLTAAHRELPIPVYARVVNLDNGKEVIVKINDRGPFAHNRIIDLSYAAAQRIDMVDRGTAPVRIEILTGKPAGTTSAAAGQGGSGAAPTTTASRSDRAAATPVAATTAGARLPGNVAEESPEAGASRASSRPAAGSDARYYMQVGAFSQRDNADTLKRSLSDANLGPVEIKDNGDGPVLYRVRVGPVDNEDELNRLGQRLRERGLQGTRVVINP